MGIDLSGMLSFDQGQDQQQQQQYQQDQQQEQQQQQYVDQSQTMDTATSFNTISLEQMFSQSNNVQLASNDLQQVGPTLKYAFENQQETFTNGDQVEELSVSAGQECWFPLCIVAPVCCGGVQEFPSECVAKCKLGYQQFDNISGNCTRGTCQAEAQTLSKDTIMISHHNDQPPTENTPEMQPLSILHDLHNYVLTPSPPPTPTPLYNDQQETSIFLQNQAQEESTADYSNENPEQQGSISQESTGEDQAYTNYQDPYYQPSITQESAVLSKQAYTQSDSSINQIQSPPTPSVSIPPEYSPSLPPSSPSNYGYNMESTPSQENGEGAGVQEVYPPPLPTTSFQPPPPSQNWWQQSPNTNSSQQQQTWEEAPAVPTPENANEQGECYGEGCIINSPPSTQLQPPPSPLNLLSPLSPPPPMPGSSPSPTSSQSYAPEPLNEVFDETSGTGPLSPFLSLGSPNFQGDVSSYEQSGSNDSYGANNTYEYQYSGDTISYQLITYP